MYGKLQRLRNGWKEKPRRNTNMKKVGSVADLDEIKRKTDFNLEKRHKEAMSVLLSYPASIF